MNRKSVILAAATLSLVLSTPHVSTYAYEWAAHSGLTRQARQLVVAVTSSEELSHFLSQNLGARADGQPLYELDTRAGDLVWDEDHREGDLLDRPSCQFVERGCRPTSLVCSFDHFSPQLPFPLATHDAIYHGRAYFDLAGDRFQAQQS